MSVVSVMTANPACCLPDTPLGHVSRLMVEHDCGAIPVVDGLETLRPVGIVTDRDIVCRAVARGRDPGQMQARDVMSHPVHEIRRGADEAECVAAMERHAVRRIVVVDAVGTCCGIVAQADIAERMDGQQPIAHLLREVSRPQHLPAVYTT